MFQIITDVVWNSSRLSLVLNYMSRSPKGKFEGLNLMDGWGGGGLERPQVALWCNWVRWFMRTLACLPLFLWQRRPVRRDFTSQCSMHLQPSMLTSTAERNQCLTNSLPHIHVHTKESISCWPWSTYSLDWQRSCTDSCRWRHSTRRQCRV